MHLGQSASLSGCFNLNTFIRNAIRDAFALSWTFCLCTEHDLALPGLSGSHLPEKPTRKEGRSPCLRLFIKKMTLLLTSVSGQGSAFECPQMGVQSGTILGGEIDKLDTGFVPAPFRSNMQDNTLATHGLVLAQSEQQKYFLSDIKRAGGAARDPEIGRAHV